MKRYTKFEPRDLSAKAAKAYSCSDYHVYADQDDKFAVTDGRSPELNPRGIIFENATFEDVEAFFEEIADDMED